MPSESSLGALGLLAELGHASSTSNNLSLASLDYPLIDACWPNDFLWSGDPIDPFSFIPTFDAPSTTHLSVQQPELDLGSNKAYDAIYATLLHGPRDDDTSSSPPSSDDDSTPSLSSPSSESGSSSGMCTPKSQPAQLECEDERAAAFREEMEWLMASLAQ
jgi:hypothetical protein